jgi:hypothetical protein
MIYMMCAGYWIWPICRILNIFGFHLPDLELGFWYTGQGGVQSLVDGLVLVFALRGCGECPITAYCGKVEVDVGE